MTNDRFLNPSHLREYRSRAPKLSWLVLSLGLALTPSAQAFDFPKLVPHPDSVSHCGGNGQRPCNTWEAFPSCNSGLAQNFIKNTCGADVVGQFVEKAVTDTGQAITNAGETVGKFTVEQGRKAIDEVKKGANEAKKAIEGIAAEVYKAAAEAFLQQMKKPLEDMAKAWKDTKVRSPQSFRDFENAVKAGDGPAILAALDKVLADLFANNSSPFNLIAQDFKDANAGSLLLVFNAAGGVGITASGNIGLALDIDYLIHLGKHGKNVPFQGPVGSLFASGGLVIGPAAGVGVDLLVGYHVADPNGVNGPSFDLSLELKVAVGGGIGVGFDMTKVPWKANTAAIGLGAGVEFKLAAGSSYGVILGQLCGNGTFIALVRNCPTSSTSAPTPGSPSGTFTASLKNVRSDKCLDVTGAGTADGVNVQQWHCNNSDAQKMIFTPVVGKADVYTIKFVHSGKCLDVWGSGTENGTNLTQWNCDNATRQQFKLQALGGDVYNVIAQNSGKLVDVVRASTDNGASVFQWQSNGWNSQQWRMVKDSSSGTFTASLKNVRSDKCLDVTGAGTADGVNVQQWHCNNSDAQKMIFTPVVGKADVYTIKFVHSGKCLDVWGSGTENGTNLTQWNCDNATRQQFKLQALGGDVYNVIAQNSGKLVDVVRASTDNGASVFQWQSNGWNSQQWRMVKDL